MKQRRSASLSAVLIWALLLPCTAAAAQPVFSTDYLDNPEKYRCSFSMRSDVDETENHYAVHFSEYVYQLTGDMQRPEELFQNRTLTYAFNRLEQLTGKPWRYAEETKYPDGWSSAYISWQTKFAVSSNDTCKTEAELIEHLKASYQNDSRKSTIEETSAGGRRGLKITYKARTAPAPLHDSVTSFDEDVKYIMILESPVPHAGFACIVVESTAHGAANYYTPMKATAVAQLDAYYNDYVARCDTVINALCGAKFTVEESGVWIRPENVAPAAAEEKKDKRTDVIINTDAQKTAGESGVSVSAAVIVGVLGAGAAAAGAGVAAVGESAAEEPEQSAYTMIVGKDFGDALKLGKNQRVWARMAEVENGVPVERPDLTQGISIFSNEIMVGAASMQGVNMAAQVQIQENAPAEGILSFLYSGEHGSFRNNVRFKLLGKGEIRLAQDKINILATEAKPFELVYALINFAETEPPLEITASSGFVRLDLGKNDKGQTVILVAPGPDAQNWNHERFITPCTCEISAMDGELPVRTSFEVSVCFEGIGTAYEQLGINALPAEACIECFTDGEKEKREEKALWIPLAVMKWDEKRRLLAPDSSKSAALALSYAVHPDFEFKTPESKALAQRVIQKASLEAVPLPAPADLRTDPQKKPAAYRVMAAASPDEGAALFDIQITVQCERDKTLASLLLKAQLKPNPDFKGMVRWFLEYPLGSAAEEYITLGNIITYHGALDFIENRVYPFSGVPWSANLLWLKSESSHYENGRGDIIRKSYIAITDESFPKEINSSQFKKIQTLVHELTHVIEDQHGDYNVSARSERHTYYLQHLSDLSRSLSDLEDPSANNIKTDVQQAIQAAYWLCKDPMIVGDLSNIGPWFGGKFKVSIHALFDKYAHHIDTLGGKMSAARREAVAREFRQMYFPGNLSNYDLWNGKNTAMGYFTETDGPFKGAEWNFNWNQGVLMSVGLTHSDYTFDFKAFHWTGGNELKLRMEACIRRKDGMPDDDYLSVTLDGGTYNMAANYFPKMRSFSVDWRTLRDSNNSLLYHKTGFPMAGSWAERKK